MALEHIAGVLALAWVNNQYIKPRFEAQISQMMVDIASFAVVLLGVLLNFTMSFVGGGDSVWFAGIIAFFEFFFVGIAIFFQLARRVGESGRDLTPWKPPKAVDIGH